MFCACLIDGEGYCAFSTIVRGERRGQIDHEAPNPLFSCLRACLKKGQIEEDRFLAVSEIEFDVRVH